MNIHYAVFLGIVSSSEFGVISCSHSFLAFESAQSTCIIIIHGYTHPALNSNRLDDNIIITMPIYLANHAVGRYIVVGSTKFYNKLLVDMLVCMISISQHCLRSLIHRGLTILRF